MTNKEWVRLHSMLCDAQRAFTDLDNFQASEYADNVDSELDAYAECISSLRLVVDKLEELVKEKEKVE